MGVANTFLFAVFTAIPERLGSVGIGNVVHAQIDLVVYTGMSEDGIEYALTETLLSALNEGKPTASGHLDMTYKVTLTRCLGGSDETAHCEARIGVTRRSKSGSIVQR